MKMFTIISTCFLFCVLQSYGQWEEATLSMAKGQMGIASLGSKVFFAGGHGSTGILDVIETYDVETGLSTNDDVLSAARIVPVGTTCGTRVFFAGGGIFPTTFFKQVDIYYSMMDLWDYDNLSVERFGLSAVSHGSKVLFAGGINIALGQSYDVVDVYDTVTGSWTTTQLSLPRGTMGAAVLGDIAIFAGGYDGMMTYDRVDIYHFPTGTWDTASLSKARGFVSATAIGNKVLIAGGFEDGYVPSSRVDIYDASTDAWSTAELSVPRCSENVFVTVGRYAFYVGGGSFNGQTFNDCSDVVDVYDSETNSWSVKYLPVPLVWHSVTTAKTDDINYLVVAGGSTFDGTNWLLQDKIYLLSVGVGIDKKISEKESLRVYPNPFHDILKLQIPNDNTQNSLLANIYNMQGQMVFAKKLVNGNRNFNADLPSGIYLLKVVSADVLYTKLINIR